MYLVSAASLLPGFAACDRSSPPITPTSATAAITVVTKTPDLVSRAPAVVGGRGHVCMIDRSADVWCWGSDGHGETGGHDSACESRSGAFGCSLTPRRLTRDGQAAQVVASRETTCVLGLDGQVRCTGVLTASLAPGTKLERAVLQEDDDIPGSRDLTFSKKLVGIAALRGARQIALAEQTLCGIFEHGQVRCIGNNDHGELGVGDHAPHDGAMVVPNLHNVEQLAMGTASVCARKSDGSLYCWGSNAQGQLGVGTDQTYYERPMRVSIATNVVEVVAGDSHVCVRGKDESLWCFGGNQAYQLAQGQAADYPTPTRVAHLKAVQLSAGIAQTCARDEAGAVLCWGMPLSPDERTPRKSPTIVPGAPKANGVYTAAYGVFVADAKGALYAWGSGLNGALGTGDTLGRVRAEKLAGGMSLKVAP